MNMCISGWSMLNRLAVTIEDVFKDPRIPVDAYSPTFVKSLLVVPIREHEPIGAIGNYWSHNHKATPEQVKLLKALAASTSIALENVKLFSELKEANDFLGDSLKARDEFFEIASHELRTPVSAFKLQLQMADRKLKKNAIEESPLGVSLVQANKLSNLVEELLDVSRIRLGKVYLEPKSFNMSEFLESVIEKHIFDLQESKCQIHLSIEKNIFGEWDEERMEQVMDHLISNIIRHAPNCTVTIELKKVLDRVHLTVKDNGPGMPEEVQAKLFKKFERFHSPRQLGGLGLGLFIVKSLVEAHQGQINFSSAPHEGCTFQLSLPLKVIRTEAS